MLIQVRKMTSSWQSDVWTVGTSLKRRLLLFFYTLKAPHPTTSSFRPSSARLEILHQCRQFTDDIQFNLSNGVPLFPCVIQAKDPFLVVQFVVAVADEETGEIWASDTTPEVEQLYVTVS